jgi:hypothetical protein
MEKNANICHLSNYIAFLGAMYYDYKFESYDIVIKYIIIRNLNLLNLNIEK